MVRAPGSDEVLHRRRVNARLAGLSPREHEVLDLVAKGLTYAQIGERLFIAHETVKSHMRSVRNKLRVRTRTEAVVVGFRKGMLG